MNIPFALLLLVFSATCLAAEPPKTKPAPAKSQFNTQVYEKEQSSESFSAVVKVVREVQGETEVFFEGKQGFYTLANPSMQERLVKSQKNQRPVTVQVDSTSRQITSVEFKE
jgi:hypothetical protein